CGYSSSTRSTASSTSSSSTCARPVRRPWWSVPGSCGTPTSTSSHRTPCCSAPARGTPRTPGTSSWCTPSRVGCRSWVSAWAT
ncbi:MAG: Anthranilate synthase, amidotransferase component, partial [uncultured Pseudonocardia sp.]